jgi:hypothetical protein
MAKIIHFPSPKNEDTPEEFMLDTIKTIKEMEAETIIIAAKNKEGYWVTGYLNADWATRNEALGHIQADIIDQMILSNLDRYSE